MNKLMHYLILVIVGITIAGCTGLNPLPMAGRAGDTVSIALGSADGMSRGNTTVTFTSDSDGVPIDVTANVKSIFRLYPDNTSKMIINDDLGLRNLTTTSGHSPWLSIMAIDLPVSLPVGTGVFNITTSATFPTVTASVNSADITFEVLPGIGAPHPLEFRFGLNNILSSDLLSLELESQVVVKPLFVGTGTWPTYGAIELVIQFQVGESSGGYHLVSDDTSIVTGSGRNVLVEINAANELTVMYISPYGLLEYYESRFSLVQSEIRTRFVGPFPTVPPIVVSARYFDIDGVEVAGPVNTSYLVTLE